MMKKNVLCCMAIILIILLVFASIYSKRNNSGSHNNSMPWSMVRHGMSIAEVLDILGPPHDQLGDSTRFTIYYQARGRQDFRTSSLMQLDNVVIVFTNGYVKMVAPGYK